MRQSHKKENRPGNQTWRFKCQRWLLSPFILFCRVSGKWNVTETSSNAYVAPFFESQHLTPFKQNTERKEERKKDWMRNELQDGSFGGDINKTGPENRSLRLKRGTVKIGNEILSLCSSIIRTSYLSMSKDVINWMKVSVYDKIIPLSKTTLNNLKRVFLHPILTVPELLPISLVFIREGPLRSRGCGLWVNGDDQKLADCHSTSGC